METKIVELVLKTTAFIIIVVGLILLARTLYSGFVFNKEEVLQKTESVRTTLLKNLETCDKIDDTECFCEVFPNFPASLPEQFSISIERKESKTNATLILKNEIIDWIELNSEIGAIDMPENKKILGVKKISFDDYPKIDNEKTIFSKYALKNDSKILFVTAEKAEQIEKLSLEEMPKCTKGRKNAIDFIDSLMSQKEDSNVISVNIEEGYYIVVNSATTTLYKDGVVVKRILLTPQEKLFGEQFEWGVIGYSFFTLTSCNNELILKKGDKIKINDKNDKKCIEKV